VSTVIVGRRDSWLRGQRIGQLIRFLIKQEIASGPYNGMTPEPVTHGEIARTLGRVLKRPAILPMPGFALKTIVGEVADIPQAAIDQGSRFRFPTLEAVLRQVPG